MTARDFADAKQMDELAIKYDIINSGDVPAR
jgi:hypothetical protein